MITDWIDDLCAVWTIAVNDFKQVRSVAWDDLPESIDLNELADHPVALTFWPALEAHYSVGGPKIAFWRGETEIHLCADFQKQRARELAVWYQLVLSAAAGHVKLNNKVEYFIIPEEQDSIVLTSLQYGEEARHWGLVVKWLVKERVDNAITVTL